MRIQLWSYNFDPEPTGIAPLSRVWAGAMRDRGHDVRVVAAHPHYPQPDWGIRLVPYREKRGGIPVLRLPIWPGRGTAAQRIRQELTYNLALAGALPFLGRPDVIVAVSPSFPALAPTMAAARARRVPWVLWLQDILPDGAMVTGVLEEGRLIDAARRLELAAYRSATRVVGISESFRENLLQKGVPDEKIVRIYNPASMPIREQPRPEGGVEPATVLTMGNIGHTQNLVEVTRAFEASGELERLGTRFVMAGDGVAATDVAAAIRSDRVVITGVVDNEELERHLMSATLALVSQQYEGIDFNVPSKLMNFMGHGVPVVAAVRPESEVARLVEEAGCGWVTESPEECAATLARVIPDAGERGRRGEAGLRFAQERFAPQRIAEQFEAVLESVVH